MSQPIPDWVSFESEKTVGLDLLGLRAPVQAIGNDLFNGVTTITPKLRYLSVITWIVWRYAQARLPDQRSAFMEFAAAQEAVVVLANRLENRSITNLVGVEQADIALDSGRSRLSLKKLAQNIALNAYISSSRQLNLGRATDRGIDALSEERGEALAKEFDKIIRASSYGPRLAKKPRVDTISRAELKELSAKLSLEKLPRGERDILVEAIFPREPIDLAEKRRLETYTLLLWLSRAKHAPLDESDVFRAAQVRPDNLPSCLASITDGWLGYVVRDLLAACHEAVFEAVMRQVDQMSSARQSPALAAEVVASLTGGTEDKNAALRAVRLLRPGETVSTVSFRTIRERVQRACRRQEAVSNGLRRWKGGLSEVEIYDLALGSHEAAIALLPVAWCLAAQRVIREPKATPLQRRILSIGTIFQVGIADVILPKIEEFARHDRTLSEVMVELTTRSVQQHLRIAWKRFSAPRGKDVSVLVADMETWSRNNAFRAGRTASRLWVALDWLDQLGLTNETGLTANGERTLKRSLDVLGRQ